MKTNYKTLAETTLRIIQTGNYEVDGKAITIKEEIGDCVFDTKTYTPETLDVLLQKTTEQEGTEAQVSVMHGSTIEAILNYRDGLKTAVLNFASAKNPGGGFMGGAIAQEESLARSSSLYASQTKDMTLYTFNKKNASFLYSDYMIYSPGVVFWMNDEGAFLNPPALVDVITSPAPNKGAMMQHARRNEIAQLETVFKKRMGKVFALAKSKGVERLILGAWGCGVFKNDYEEVATYFSELIETKYKYSFKEIVFAIYDRSKTKGSLEIFQRVFNHKSQTA
jgi:uncharacterized protein (TIGR02452 family)